MIEETTLRQNGESLEATLPKGMTDRLGVAAGDSVLVIEMEGGILITPRGGGFAQAMEAGQRVSERYPHTLGELA